MGKAQRDKGARFEREMVHKFSDAGMPAKRVPLSGATWLKSDIIVDIRGVERPMELKKRGDGFKQLYDWLGDANYALVVAADRRPPLVVLPFDNFAELAPSHD